MFYAFGCNNFLLNMFKVLSLSGRLPPISVKGVEVCHGRGGQRRLLCFPQNDL